MKFFGWGRKKDPPPTQSLHESNKEDTSTRTTRVNKIPHCEPGGVSWGLSLSGKLGSSPQPLGKNALRPISEDFVGHQVVFSGDEEFLSHAGSLNPEGWKRTLQETIRFVFTQEQEGLLTIGTFALDQLSELRESHLEVCEKFLDSNLSRPGFETSSLTSVSNVVLPQVRSSEDEVDSNQSWNTRHYKAGCTATKKTGLPVFVTDSTTPGPVPDAKDGLRRAGIDAVNLMIQLPVRDSPDLPRHGTGDKKRAEGQPQAGFRPEAPAAENHQPDEYYSPSGCGLFAFTRRTHVADKEKRRKPPDNQAGGAEAISKKAISKGDSMGRIGRLWRSGFKGSVSKVAPEKNLCQTAEPELQMQDPPCIANLSSSRVEEDDHATRRSSRLRNCLQKTPTKQQQEAWEPRRRSSGGKGWACDQNGKWIKTDSEFVVLEM